MPCLVLIEHLDSPSTRDFYEWATHNAVNAVADILAALWKYESDDAGSRWIYGFTHEIDERSWCAVTLHVDHELSEERMIELLLLTDGKFSIYIERQ